MILKYKDFLNESNSNSSSFYSLPKGLIKYFTDNVSKNIITKTIWDGSGFDILLEGSNVYFTLGGKKILFPFIKYVDNKVIIDKEAIVDFEIVREFYNDIGLDLDFKNIAYHHILVAENIKLRDGEPNRVGQTVNYNGFSFYIYRDYYLKENRDLDTILTFIFNHIKWKIKENLKKSTINPFIDLNLMDNPIMKIIMGMGGLINSSERQKKSGTIRIDFPKINPGIKIEIVPSGYIRRFIIQDNDRQGTVLNNSLELGYPIRNEADLNIKLCYIAGYILKKILKNTLHLPDEISNKAAKALVTSDFRGYSEIIKDITTKYPQSAYILPDPDNVLDPAIKNASSIMSRFNF